MIKSFRRIKASIIMGILMVCIFAAFTTNTSAGIVKVEPLITVTHPRADENVIPKSGVLDIPLNTSFELTGIGAGYVETSSLLRESSVTITLTVVEKNDWIDASITNSPAIIKVGGSVRPWSSTLSLTVTEKAPAFSLGMVKIRATSNKLPGLLFDIDEKSQDFEIPFEVGYWPVVNYEVPEGNLKEIGPLDTADFPIELDNLGNGVTYVSIEIIEMPGEDWTASIPSSVTLSSSVYTSEGGNKAIVHLTIKPPYGFGFHNERKSFKVKFTPQYLGRPDLVGQPEIMTFNIQSVGMSPGAGFEIPLIVTILVVLFVGIYIYKRRK